MRDYSLFGDEHVRKYEETGGQVGHAWNGTQVLILHVIGRNSGKTRKVPLIYEPLNRYETNLCCNMAAGVKLLQSSDATNVKLLADLFHLNIEEVDIAAAIRAAGTHVGHVHFVDSNRRAADEGHLDYAPIVAALREINFNGYASAEVLPWPDPRGAAERAIKAYRRWFR